MYIRHNIGKFLKTMITKPTDKLNKYLDGQIYIFEKLWLEKPTGYMFIHNKEYNKLLC